jgi:hypothetical protein
MKTIRLNTKIDVYLRELGIPLEVKIQDTSNPSRSLDKGLLEQGYLYRGIGLVKYARETGLLSMRL